MADDEKEIPASGAVFTFGRSRFADNIPSHFFIRNDPIVDIDCGDEHTTIVCQNGRVFAFGSNEWGQLGLGHRSPTTKPSCIKSLKPEQATHVACGRAHTIISTGKVYSCGNNSDGQLGLGDTDDRDVLTNILGIVGTVEQLSAGCHHSAAVTSWSEQIPRTVQDSMPDKGDVFVWGSNADGQLGLGKDIKQVTTPVRLELKETIAKIACGYYHTVFLTEEGQLLVCGEGEGGKLGLGLSGSVFVPTTVSLEAWPTCIAAGGNHTIVVAVDGKVYGWGSNLSGQLGFPDNKQDEVLVPTLVSSLSERVIKEVACGESHSAFITEQGELLTCGETRHGKLGCEASGSDPSCTCVPTKVSRFKPYTVTKVCCGGCHTMVLASPRTDNSDNHLSNGHVAHVLQPPMVDVVSPPVVRGSLPPLQRIPHINSTSIEDKLSKEESMSSNIQLDSKFKSPNVPEVEIELVEDGNEKGDEEEKEKDSNESAPKSTPETVSINEKFQEPDEDDNCSIVTIKQQTIEEIKSQAELVTASACESVSKEKSSIVKKISQNGMSQKINTMKKSKMCVLL